MTDKLDPKTLARIEDALFDECGAEGRQAGRAIARIEAALAEAGAVVPVTCGECRHSEGRQYAPPGEVYCRWRSALDEGPWVKADWYCADGEREVFE